MKWFVKVIFKAVKLLLNVILGVIDSAISTIMPSVTAPLAAVSSFFGYLINPILWVKSWLPFNNAFWVSLASFIIFRYTVPLITHTIKVVVAWYNALKP